MKRGTILRLVSLVMLAAAAIFVACALSCPTCGSVFYIGSMEVGPREWWIFYKLYAAVTAGLFLLSFWPDRKK